MPIVGPGQLTIGAGIRYQTCEEIFLLSPKVAPEQYTRLALPLFRDETTRNWFDGNREVLVRLSLVDFSMRACTLLVSRATWPCRCAAISPTRSSA